MTNRPTDPREFVRMSVDIAHHPKVVALEDPAAAWGYAAALAYAGKYHTDGWITIRTVAHEGGISTQKARKLVRVGLLHEHGHTCKKCPEVPKGQAYLHDYLEHNRSKDEVEEQRRSAAERGRKGAAKRWSKRDETTPKTTPETDSNSHSTSQGTSNSYHMAEVEEEKEISTHLPTPAATTERASTPATTPTGPAITGTNSATAYRLVAEAIGRNIPSTIRTALAIEAATLLPEIGPDITRTALQRWNTRTGIGPRVLASIATDLVKEQAAGGTTLAAGARTVAEPGAHGREAKARGWLALGAESGPEIGAQGSFLVIEGGRAS
ncbi:hypothetical protein BAY59_31395 [Prauserella coralliicola]|nr:hypothetical protein BAY59_31395 [Prauserella coralliicola]